MINIRENFNEHYYIVKIFKKWKSMISFSSFKRYSNLCNVDEIVITSCYHSWSMQRCKCTLILCARTCTLCQRFCIDHLRLTSVYDFYRKAEKEIEWRSKKKKKYVRSYYHFGVLNKFNATTNHSKRSNSTRENTQYITIS